MEVRQPWSGTRAVAGAVLLGGFGGVLAVGVAPAAVAVAVGAGVAVAGYAGIRAASTRTRRVPDPAWSSRAEEAFDRFRAGTSEAGGVAVLRAGEVVAVLSGLAGQLAAAGRVLARFDTGRLVRQAERLRREAATSTGSSHDHSQRAVRAVDEQLALAERLATVRRTGLERVESAVLALERLAADPSGTGGDGEPDWAAVVGELDALQAGLAGAAGSARRALLAAGPWIDPVAGPGGGDRGLGGGDRGPGGGDRGLGGGDRGPGGGDRRVGEVGSRTPGAAAGPWGDLDGVERGRDERSSGRTPGSGVVGGGAEVAG